MTKINAYNLYKFIINHLDEHEIAKPEICTVIYDKFYYNNNKKQVRIRVPSVADFLLTNLHKNYGKMITIEQLQWWLKLATAHKNQRHHSDRYKYQALIEDLEKEHQNEKENNDYRFNGDGWSYNL